MSVFDLFNKQPEAKNRPEAKKQATGYVNHPLV
jgi:hypothetical protein